MANTLTAETIRQMMIDWNAATPAQRAESLKKAAEAASQAQGRS